jgi:hypothetical protein
MSWNPTARVIAYIYICTYIPTCTSESYRFVGSHLVLRKPLWKRVTSATYLHSFQSCLKSRKFHSWPSLSTLELWSDWTFFCQFLRPVINCVSTNVWQLPDIACGKIGLSLQPKFRRVTLGEIRFCIKIHISENTEQLYIHTYKTLSTQSSLKTTRNTYIYVYTIYLYGGMYIKIS